MEFDEYSKALYPPSYQAYLGFHYHLDSRAERERWFSTYLLVIAWYACSISRSSSFDSSCLEALMASRACYVAAS
ncbi:hypothetical protein F2Q70_00003871 [Brassica cretica]|uniref:Uncharacterized protein n=1 Tax=Brassica cretica TaxID=69181 RepID=A0A8S9IL92_BRACR|nr:hypothetical protein F2Q70_00003871 [Brassica cretica]KAF3564389.1 hypothetical protein DY000_02015790 [Brassica cretica]